MSEKEDFAINYWKNETAVLTKTICSYREALHRANGRAVTAFIVAVLFGVSTIALAIAI